MPFLDYYFQKKQTNVHLLFRTEEIKHTTCLKIYEMKVGG